MVLYSPDWTNIGFSFIFLTVNLLYILYLSVFVYIHGMEIYSLSKLTLDGLIFAKIFVIFVRFRGVLRPWSRFYSEYADRVNSLMQMV